MFTPEELEFLKDLILTHDLHDFVDEDPKRAAVLRKLKEKLANPKPEEKTDDNPS